MNAAEQTEAGERRRDPLPGLVEEEVGDEHDAHDHGEDDLRRERVIVERRRGERHIAHLRDHRGQDGRGHDQNAFSATFTAGSMISNSNCG